MLKKLTQPKILIFAFAGIAVLGLLIWFGVRLYRLQQAPGSFANPISFDTCGEELKEMCVFSFGRDADGNTIVNLYVPEEEKFPAFYLKVIRETGEEIVYECDKNDEVKTSVYCVGGALNLEERFEVQVVSIKDDQPLAQGKFTLTAFLVVAGETSPRTQPSEDASSTEALATPTASSITATPIDSSITATPTIRATSVVAATETSVSVARGTPTATSSVSYPSYP
ncbi:MAG: hypothetical protein JNK32_03275 [Anaerolineales bacterium]|nr:hypothetical protein [Anaerolineales bacterium]